MWHLGGVGSFTQGHTAGWRETTGPPRAATRLFHGLLPFIQSAPLPPESFDNSTLEGRMGGVQFFTVLSQVTGKEAPGKSRNVSSLVSDPGVFLFPTLNTLGCFCSAKTIKSLLQGKKNSQLASFLFLSVHFLERVRSRSSLIGVGAGQFPTQVTMTPVKSKAKSAQLWSNQCPHPADSSVESCSLGTFLVVSINA